MSKKLYEVTISSDFFTGQLHAEVWADSEEEAEQIAYDEWREAPRDAEAYLIDEGDDDYE